VNSVKAQSAENYFILARPRGESARDFSLSPERSVIVADIQRPASNAEHRIQRRVFCIRRWAFGVQRSAFSPRF
jgi:hypothetical protein